MRAAIATAIAAALALAGCASVPSTLTLPAGYPQPLVAPDRSMCAWPDLPYAAAPDSPPELQTLDLITPIGVFDQLVRHARSSDAAARPSGSAGSAGPAGLGLGHRPVIVYIHGGSFSAGSKRGGLEQKATRIVGSGEFLLASINYRLAPAAKHPAQVADTAAAIAWLHDHAAEYGGAPDRIVLVGHSAGAHLAALVATDARWLAKHGLSPSILAGVASLDGAGFDLEQRTGGKSNAERRMELVFGSDRAVWADASPIHHVAAGKGTPPFLLIYAGDREISATANVGFAAKLAAAGIPCEIVHAVDKDHHSINRELGEIDDDVTARVLAFAEQVTRSGIANQEGPR